ncbi:alpha/beta fold hydrolase [Spongiivirga sp. MCCC 1A20706]|uniref:alpha/beta fold hydrolase n=1 Tax=Spongiivirga sp. MCCC 1A20706 TaxID=3160963 RepID=UPI00397784D8
MLLHSKILGEGTPLVILHGFLGMSDNWKTLGSRFSESGFQVHLVDQRNHGRSFHSADFSYQHMADDILYYCDHYQLEKTHIIGHSMGGKTAMLFATDNAEKVEKLLVADIGPQQYPPHHQEILNGLSALDFSKITSRKEADESLSKYIQDQGIRMFLLKNIYRTDKNTLGLRINLEVLKESAEDIGEALPNTSIFHGKTLFLKGEKSGYITPNNTALIKLHFPEASVQTVSNAGHWLHAENQQEFYDKAAAFLTA